MGEGGGAPRGGEEAEAILRVRGLGVAAGGRAVLRNVNLAIPHRRVFGILGPSGVGKSTLLRCLNRMVDLDPSLAVTGDVLLHGRSTRGPEADPDGLRARMGMLFQQPVVFPTSILRNVLFGARHARRLSRSESEVLAERALREAALWDEVRDRLHEPAARLSVGQQQRLCLSRALALEPEVLLMDEPTSALDPRATAAIEDLIRRLAAARAVVLVTHNHGQARRLADRLACLGWRDGVGEVIACGPPAEVLGVLEPTDESVG